MTPALKKCPAVGNRQENSRHEKIFKKSESEGEESEGEESEGDESEEGSEEGSEEESEEEPETSKNIIKRVTSPRSCNGKI